MKQSKSQIMRGLERGDIGSDHQDLVEAAFVNICGKNRCQIAASVTEGGDTA